MVAFVLLPFNGPAPIVKAFDGQVKFHVAECTAVIAEHGAPIVLEEPLECLLYVVTA